MSDEKISETNNDENNSVKMTFKTIRNICRNKFQYDTPELNDTLYLNYQGFSKIENLDRYYNVKSLFLEGNGIISIENLSKLIHLKALYLQNNFISKIQNLNAFTNLTTLNLSSNNIKKIEGLQSLVHLQTLDVSNNMITTNDDLIGVLECPSIINLHLNNNQINNEETIYLLSGLMNLKCLYLKNNPFLKKMEFYRKYITAKIESLTFLDDRPIFENERRLNLAWMRGGRIEMDNEREKIQMEKRMKRKQESSVRQKYLARYEAMQKRLKKEANLHILNDVTNTNYYINNQNISNNEPKLDEKKDIENDDSNYNDTYATYYNSTNNIKKQNKNNENTVNMYQNENNRNYSSNNNVDELMQALKVTSLRMHDDIITDEQKTDNNDNNASVSNKIKLQNIQENTPNSDDNDDDDDDELPGMLNVD